MKKEKLIFIYPKLFTFIETEIKLLSDDYEIISKNQNWSNKYLFPFNLVMQFLFLLINIRKVNTILVSFGGYWSYLPALVGKIFNKKVAIVVHGTDCVYFPEINYGNLRIALMRWFTKKSYQLADIILPVSESLVYSENNYYSDKVLKFGYSHHLKNIKTTYKVIPNGLIIEDWKKDNTDKKENTFITVMNSSQTERKGAHLIVEAAKKLPNCTFYFAGTDNIKGIDILPKNIVCLGRLSPKQLKIYYSETQFYLQLSNFEGFGVAICEAMLCNCVPIVSDVNYLPIIAGESGFVLNRRDSNLLVDLINSSLKVDLSKLGDMARMRIEKEFPVSKRKEMLISALKDIKNTF